MPLPLFDEPCDFAAKAQLHLLHIPASDLTDTVAVAYVSAHFELGVYLSWEGFVDTLEADAR